MGKGFQGAMLRAMRVEEHTATVIESEWLTQHVVHITFHSDTLLNSDGELPASWVRIWFPDHEGQGKLHQRCYTLLHADPTTGVFSIAFLSHIAHRRRSLRAPALLGHDARLSGLSGVSAA